MRDDKPEVFDKAEVQYNLMMGVLGQINRENPHSLIPLRLLVYVKDYEERLSYCTSMDLSDALKRYWKDFDVPKEYRSRLEDIATITPAKADRLMTKNEKNRRKSGLV